MKKWITLVILFIAVPLHAKARRPAPAEDDFTVYQSSGYITWASTSSFIAVSSATFHWDSPAHYTFSDCWRGPCKEFLDIDASGDIFLRGKWIGWDWRLSKQYRDTGKWIEPRETAIPGNQGRIQ